MAGPVDLTVLRDTISKNQIKFLKLERDVSRLKRSISQISQVQQSISNGEFEITVGRPLKSKKVSIIIKDDPLFNSFLKTLISCEGYTNVKSILEDSLKDSSDDEVKISDDDLKIIVNRLSHLILLMKEVEQAQAINRFLNCISVARITTITKTVFHTNDFNQDLLTRIQADALVFPLFSAYAPPKGCWNEAKTIWRLCIEDIDNFLLSFDTLTATPMAGGDAFNYFHAYQMILSLFKDNAYAYALPFVVSAVRKLVRHYVESSPSALPPLLEFTNPNFYQAVAPVNNRNKIFGEIESAWKAGETPILVGEPGCGKTSILIELARRINEGRFDFLKGNYRAFGGSATSLANAGGEFANEHIRRVLTKIAEKRDVTILMLDEVDAFDKNQKMLLRSFFDQSPNSIRYAVFAMTSEGQNSFFEGDDGSLKRRFPPILVENFSLGETKIILHHQAHAMASTFIVAPQVITRIVNQANGSLTPARKILCQVIRKAVEQNGACPSQKAFQDKTTEIDLARLHHSDRITTNPREAQESANRLNLLEEERSALSEQLQFEQTKVKNHALLLAKRTQLRYKILDVSQTILRAFHAELLSKSKQIDQLSFEDAKRYFLDAPFQDKIAPSIKEFAYYNFWMQPYLTEKIRAFERDHQFVSEITDGYVLDSDLVLPE